VLCANVWIVYFAVGGGSKYAASWEIQARCGVTNASGIDILGAATNSFCVEFSWIKERKEADAEQHLGHFRIKADGTKEEADGKRHKKADGTRFKIQVERVTNQCRGRKCWSYPQYIY